MTGHHQNLNQQKTGRKQYQAFLLERAVETSRQEKMVKNNQTQGKVKDNRKKNQTREFNPATIRAIEGEGNERKFILSFSSEEPYSRYWGNEILDHSPAAADLTRLNEIGVLLFNHNRDKVLGKVNRAWIENQRGMAEVEFDKDEESELVFKKVKNGTLKGVSIGYKIDAIEEVSQGKVSSDGRFAGPCGVARQWMPYEISIVSVPADATVGVGRSSEECTAPPEKTLTYFEAQLQINKNRRYK